MPYLLAQKFVPADPELPNKIECRIAELERQLAALTATTTTDTAPETTAVEAYTAEVIQNYMDSCQLSGGTSEFCRCVIDQIQDSVPYRDFVRLDLEMQTSGGATLPDWMIDAIVSCL